MMSIESSNDDVADRNNAVDRVVKVLLLLKFEDDEKLPMIYRCITLMMLKIPSLLLLLLLLL